MLCRASDELHGSGNWIPKGTLVTPQPGKTYVGMTGAKFELWLAGTGEQSAAPNSLEAPLMTLTEGSGEQTQEVTD